MLNCNPHRPEQNYLLRTLPEEDFSRLRSHLELVTLNQGQVVVHPGTKFSHAFFPTTAIISVVYMMENGDTAAMADVGNEGILGVPLFMGGNSTPNSAVVQSAGFAYQLHPTVLAKEFNRNGPLLNMMLRYALASLTQITQTSICNRLHHIEQQLCRLLLKTIDRLPTDEIASTHEHIALVLGVRRESITAAARKLQDAGYIRYQRGKVQILNRTGLEKTACECYHVVKKEYHRLLPRSVPGMHAPELPMMCKFGIAAECLLTDVCRKRTDCMNKSLQALYEHTRHELKHQSPQSH